MQIAGSNQSEQVFLKISIQGYLSAVLERTKYAFVMQKKGRTDFHARFELLYVSNYFCGQNFN